jgi:hypothetical protein
MTVRIEIPYPGFQRSILLPNPILTDSRSHVARINFGKSVNNTSYTYVMTNEDEQLVLKFEDIARGKILELIDLIERYGEDVMRITLHNGDIWKGYFENIPADFEISKLSSPAGGGVSGRDESGSFELIITGEQIG